MKYRLNTGIIWYLIRSSSYVDPKIHLKVMLLRSKIVHKQLLNISKQLSKSPKNYFFGPQNGQNDPLNGPNFDIKF